jgi:carbamoyltransferase
MTVILGFNAFYADSDACLVVDGVLQGAVAEEQLGDRVKHTSDFPANAILSVLWMRLDRMARLLHLSPHRQHKQD